MKVTCVYWNAELNKFEYSKEMIEFDSTIKTDPDHADKMYFHATRDLNSINYNIEMAYAATMCEMYNHNLEVYPYVLNEDSVVICKDCKLPFVLGVGEKHWYSTHSLNMPCRCKPCIDKRKIKKAEEASK